MRKGKFREASPVSVLEKDECSHYWVIESATGPTSQGVCKFCGVARDFQNSFLDPNHQKRDSRVLKESSELLETEPDKEPDDSELEKKVTLLAGEE